MSRNKPAQTVERVTSALIRRKNDLKRAAKGKFSFPSRQAMVEALFANKGLGSIGADPYPVPDSIPWVRLCAKVDGSAEMHHWAMDRDGKVTYLGTNTQPVDNAYTAELKAAMPVAA